MCCIIYDVLRHEPRCPCHTTKTMDETKMEADKDLIDGCEWVLRVNPYERTDQNDMFKYIVKNKVIICPFGHIGEYRMNVLRRVYNVNHPVLGSSGQDKRFVEEIEIGDTILVMFTSTKKYLIVEVLSSACEVDVHYSYTDDGSIIRIQHNDEIDIDSSTIAHPFKPVVRFIAILDSGTFVRDMKRFPRNPFTKRIVA